MAYIVMAYIVISYCLYSSDRVGVHAQVFLKMCVRGTHDQRSLTHLDQKRILMQTHVSVLLLLKLM